MSARRRLRPLSSLPFLPLLALPLLAGCGEGRAGTSAPGVQAPHADVRFPDSWRFSADDRPVLASDGMVSTADHLATEVGLRVLEPEVVRALEGKGHAVLERPGISGNVQAVMVLSDGTLAGWADPRLGGNARGH